MTNKKHFLIEHNKLSPLNLQATLLLLTHFKKEKISLFKDDNWSIEKLRRPFISWFLSLPETEKKDYKKQKNEKAFKNYPSTKF